MHMARRRGVRSRVEGGRLYALEPVAAADERSKMVHAFGSVRSSVWRDCVRRIFRGMSQEVVVETSQEKLQAELEKRNKYRETLHQKTSTGGEPATAAPDAAAESPAAETAPGEPARSAAPVTFEPGMRGIDAFYHSMMTATVRARARQPSGDLT